MNRNQKLTAGMVLNTYSKEALARIIEDFGEDRFARNIAANIVKFREVKPFETTHELAEVVDKSIPYAVKKTGGHPAKRTFQALRIEVNSELNGLSDAVLACIRRIKKGGRMAVISFHSLEDRIIKNVFKELDTSCICPHGTPICICGKVREVKIVNTKPITPTESEMSENSRAKSAKLRVIEKM
ncbi:s-adenosyl-methyltransferase mraw [Holotrichia oblita]|nr:s-adenosyl-methyltransferase mraw [Holotrichia oblita]